MTDGQIVRKATPNSLQLRRWSSSLFKPFDYQTSIASGLSDLADSGEKVTGVLSLPTGAGKTSTCALSVLTDMKRQSDSVVWWIATQRELLYQSFSAFSKVWHAGYGPQSLDLVIPQSTGPTIDSDRSSVVFATPQFFIKALTDGVLNSPTHVVFDEAHHLAAPTYSKLWGQATGSSDKIRMAIGLTATPSRTTRTSFESLLDLAANTLFLAESLLPDPVRVLQQRGVLSSPQCELLPSVPGYLSQEKIQKHQAEYHPDLWSSILEEVQTRPKTKTIIYMPTLNSASLLADFLTHSGFSADFLSGSHSADQRIRTLERFRDSKSSILVNVNLLLEGVDMPDAERVIIPYTPTNILLNQMVGRVIRGSAVGGSDFAKVCVADNVALAMAKAINLSHTGQISQWGKKHLFK